jgi:DNA-binding CsgD family transcriptional regulator
MADPQLPASSLAHGRALFAQGAWNQAYHALQQAATAAPLPAEDLERLSSSAHLLGREEERIDLLTRAHQAFLDSGRLDAAARTAIWLAMALEFRGQPAQSNGWIARARRLLEQHGRECVEQGYLSVPAALRAFLGGDTEAAYAHFVHAGEVAHRFGDPDLAGLARHGQGRSLLRLGRVVEGVALLDEVMVAVTSGEVSPVIAGDLYCSVLEGCHEIYDLRRAQEWTLALKRWCEAQPELVAYRGACQARRSEILLLHGEWPEAEVAAREACEHLPDRAAAYAWYQLGELYRQQGELEQAERAYNEAGARGLQPEPGMALLRLVQGRTAQAGQSIRRSLAEARDRRVRWVLLGAAVEIAVAEGDLPAAEQSAQELEQAAQHGVPYLEAAAAQARGLVTGAKGDCGAALESLRLAARHWRELGLPYHAARVAVLVSQACRKEGDADAAAIELQAARRVFERLGARHDLARLAEQLTPARAEPDGGLTGRELEVLTMVAAGHSNRVISVRLGISEKTVARHISNIFTKLNLSSRAAATAYAYQHRLVRTPT